MQWGEKIDFLQEVVAPKMAAQGKSVPALDTRPKLSPHLISVWDAYASLERDRQMTMAGPGPIPFTSIDRFARRYGIDDLGEFDRFRRLIMAMDSEYLKFVDEKMKQEDKRNGH